MSTDLDRLELELRCVPGVVAVGLDRNPDGDGLLVQALVLGSDTPSDLRAHLRRVVSANVREQISLEVVVEASPGLLAPSLPAS